MDFDFENFLGDFYLKIGIFLKIFTLILETFAAILNHFSIKIKVNLKNIACNGPYALN